MAHGGNIYDKKIIYDFSVNLNPLGMPGEIKEAITESVDRSMEYPDINQTLLRNTAAEAEGISPLNIYGGCGASELIPAIIRSEKTEHAILFSPCYTGYENALTSYGSRISYIDTGKKDGFYLTKADIDIIPKDADIIFVSDPVNPTGRNLDDDIIAYLLEKAYEIKAKVVLDESFYLLSDKAADSWRSKSIGLLKQYDDLYILRSFTKIFAVPGIRAGLVISSEDNISKLIRQLPEWNLPVTGEAVMIKGYDILINGSFLGESLKAVIEGRRYLADDLKKLGLKVYESDTSYILFEGPEYLGDNLLNKGLLIRTCDDIKGLGDGFYRIAVKNVNDNRELIRIIGESLV